MTVVYAKQVPAVDIGAGPISEEGNPGKANGHSSLHTQSQLVFTQFQLVVQFTSEHCRKKTIKVAKFTKARKQQN